MEIFIKESGQQIFADEFIARQNETVARALGKLRDELLATGKLSGLLCDYNGDQEWIVQVKNQNNSLQQFWIGIVSTDSTAAPVIDHRTATERKVQTQQVLIIDRTKAETEVTVNDGYNRDIYLSDTWTVEEYQKRLNPAACQVFLELVSRLDKNTAKVELRFIDPETKREIVCTGNWRTVDI